MQIISNTNIMNAITCLLTGSADASLSFIFVLACAFIDVVCVFAYGYVAYRVFKFVKKYARKAFDAGENGEITKKVFRVFARPAVILHESSHAIAAILCGTKLTEVHFRPTMLNGELVQGAIFFRPSTKPKLRAAQQLTIGTAPVIASIVGVVIAIFVILPLLPTPIYISILLIVYPLFCFAYAGGLSQSDLPRSKKMLFVAAVILFILFLFLPFDFGVSTLVF